LSTPKAIDQLSLRVSVNITNNLLITNSGLLIFSVPKPSISKIALPAAWISLTRSVNFQHHTSAQQSATPDAIRSRF
jgi:hypothetical protein